MSRNHIAGMLRHPLTNPFRKKVVELKKHKKEKYLLYKDLKNNYED